MQGITCHQCSCHIFITLDSHGPIHITTNTSPPPTTWVHVTHLDLLGAFHFGFPRPWLYSCIPTMSCHGVQKTCFPLNKLVQNPMNVATWHLFLLFLQRRLILSP